MTFAFRCICGPLSTLAWMPAATLLLSVPAAAQTDQAVREARARLVGGTWHLWDRGEFRSSGSSGNCYEEDETYRFKSDGTVAVSRCIDSKWVTTGKRWKIERRGLIDIILTVGKEPYELDFNQQIGHRLMRLRQSASGKGESTKDQIYRQSND